MIKIFLKCAALVSALWAGQVAAETFNLRATILGHQVGLGEAGVLAANTSVQIPIEFRRVDLHNGMVALRDISTRLFVRTGGGQYTYLRADTNSVNAASIFEFHRDGRDLRLRSMRTGQYLGYDVGSGRLRTVFGTQHAHSMFTILPTQAERPAGGEPAPGSAFSFAGSWRLNAVAGPNGGTIALSREALSGAQLTITVGGGVSGSDGCNRVGGSIVRRGAAMRFEDILMTRRLCHGDQGRVAQAMQNAFNTGAWIEASETGSAMRILDESGRELLRFSRR